MDMLAKCVTALCMSLLFNLAANTISIIASECSFYLVHNCISHAQHSSLEKLVFYGRPSGKDFSKFIFKVYLYQEFIIHS